MRARTVIGLALLTGTAHGQSISSQKFVPPTAAERAQLAAADEDVLPTDVRRHPEQYQSTRVYWTGVTAGVKDGTPRVEHHYFDGVVEGSGGVWLSPWGEGQFCLMDVPSHVAARFDGERSHFVRAYGRPLMTEQGLCLSDVFLVVDDRSWTTLVLEYGPRGREDFSDADARERAAVSVHPEARLLTPVSYRVTGGAQLGKTNIDDSPLGYGWNAALELSLRTSVRTEFALMTGPESYPTFGAPSTIQSAFLFRYYLMGIGVAGGPLVGIPVRDGEPLWLGVRYLPTFGDAQGSWGLSPVLGGGADIAATTDGDVRFTLKLAVGIDGNIGAP